jgi:urease alpha subunit
MIFYSLLIYITIITILFIIKPDILFHNGRIKKFGLGNNKSICSLNVLNIFIVISIHFIISYITSLLSSK